MATKEELEEQLAKTRTDMKILASMATERGQTIAAGVRDDIQDRAAMLSEEAQALIEEAGVQGRELVGTAHDKMRSNPLAAAGLALGLGFILGSLMRR